MPQVRQEHCEVQVEHSTGTWHTDTSGPHVLYPDLASAAEWGRKLQLIHGAGKVRVKHVMADYYAPDSPGYRSDPVNP